MVAKFVNKKLEKFAQFADKKISPTKKIAKFADKEFADTGMWLLSHNSPTIFAAA